MKRRVFVKTAAFPSKKKGKSTKQCRFERHCASSSPAHAEAGEEEFCSSATLLPLSPPHLPRNLARPIPTHTLPPWWKTRRALPCGQPCFAPTLRQDSGRVATLPCSVTGVRCPSLCAPINTERGFFFFEWRRKRPREREWRERNKGRFERGRNQTKQRKKNKKKTRRILGGEKREPETGGKEGKTEGVFLEERSRNRGKEGKKIVEKTKEGRVFWVVENRKKKLGGKGFWRRRREKKGEEGENRRGRGEEKKNERDSREKGERTETNSGKQKVEGHFIFYVREEQIEGNKGIIYW